jgi:hypothetical protein
VRQFLLKINFFLFVIIILSISGCEKNYSTVVDSSKDILLATNPTFSLSVVNTDTMYIGNVQTSSDTLKIHAIASLKIIRALGEESIGSVNYFIGNFQSSLVLSQGTLPNFNPNDSVYSGYVDFQIQRYIVGDFVVKLWEQNQKGEESNTFYLPLRITRFNNAPSVSDLTAPDTLHIGNTFSFSLKASDLEGMADLYEVGFRTLKPDGSYANSGNIILMFDDGNSAFPSGDLKAGDSIYTYSTFVPSSATKGTYVYTFFALDQLHAISNTITKRIIVLP